MWCQVDCVINQENVSNLNAYLFIFHFHIKTWQFYMNLIWYKYSEPVQLCKNNSKIQNQNNKKQYFTTFTLTWKLKSDKNIFHHKIRYTVITHAFVINHSLFYVHYKSFFVISLICSFTIAIENRFSYQYVCGIW